MNTFMTFSFSSVRPFIVIVFLHVLLTIYIASQLHYGIPWSRDINNQSDSSKDIVLIEGLLIKRSDYQRLKNLIEKVHTRKTFKQNGKSEISAKDVLTSQLLFPAESFGNKSNCSEEFSGSHFITLSRHLGRAGNWMFQLATLLATAKSMCYTPVLQTTFGYSRTFTLEDVLRLKHIDRVEPSAVQGWKIFMEQWPCKYSQDIETLDNRYNWSLYGFFQSWRYFQQHEDYVRKMLKFQLHVVARAKTFLNNLPQGQQTSKVCLHVRRRDMLRQEVKEFGFNVGNITFINAAMTLVRRAFHETGNDVRFVVVTDDLSWCLRNINGDSVSYSPFTAEGHVKADSFKYDLALMSLCDHAIITGGSFGWIGGWLTQGAVIYYSDFHRKGSTFYQDYDAGDYYPADWVGLGDKELSALYTSDQL